MKRWPDGLSLRLETPPIHPVVTRSASTVNTTIATILCLSAPPNALNVDVSAAQHIIASDTAPRIAPLALIRYLSDSSRFRLSNKRISLRVSAQFKTNLTNNGNKGLEVEQPSTAKIEFEELTDSARPSTHQICR